MSFVGKAMELLNSKGVQDVFTVTGGGAIFLADGLGKAYDMEFLSID